MNRLLQLAAALLLTGALAHACAQTQPSPRETDTKPGKKQKASPENIEWLWQYTPDKEHPDGRENDLAQDLRFLPLLEQYLTAPQTVWGTRIDGRPRTLAIAALDHLSVPDKVITDEDRYVSITGCVVHFCPARGL